MNDINVFNNKVPCKQYVEMACKSKSHQDKCEALFNLKNCLTTKTQGFLVNKELITGVSATPEQFEELNRRITVVNQKIINWKCDK